MINPRKSRSQNDSLSAILVLVDEYSFFLCERPIATVATYKSARLDPRNECSDWPLAMFW